MSILTTDKQWKDILPETSVQQLKATLQRCAEADKNGTAKAHPLQYLLVFFDAPWEQKIAAAALVGAEIKKDAYRVDLKALTDGHPGETERRINDVLRIGDKNDWLLFFDEADALFGKRTDIKDSHDKYANLEIGYLLQRMEDYGRIAVMAIRDKTKLPPDLLAKFHTVLTFN